MQVFTLVTPSHEKLYHYFLAPSARAAGFTITPLRAPQYGTHGAYLEEGWEQTMRAKIDLLLEAVQPLAAGEIFLYSDCDVLFNPACFSPEQAAQALGSDIAAFQDDVVQACAGFMILRQSEEIIELLTRTRDAIATHGEDQTALNAVLRSGSYHTHCLPRSQYMNVRHRAGARRRAGTWNGKPVRIPKRCHIFHANWTTGTASKENLLSIAECQLRPTYVNQI